MIDHTTFYTTMANKSYNIWLYWASNRTHNPKVVGSNPAPATSFYKALKAIMSLRPFWFLEHVSAV